jgi:hypothetical protein
VSTFRSFTCSRLAGAVAALWLCGAGTAWAGDGGDLAGLNQLLSTPTTGLCAILNLTSCPQLPTVTQAILEVAALTNSPPEIVAAQNSITPGSNVTAGNLAAVPPPPDFGGIPFPLNSTTLPKLSGVTIQSGEPPVPGLLDTLTPLAFASQKSGTALATQLYDPKADTFLYAVGISSAGAVNSGGGGLTNADTVYFVYDDLFRVAPAFTKGQIVAKFSFPLTVLNNDGTENTAVMTTLEITSCANGQASCFNANAVGGIGTPQNPIPASQLGIQFALVFSASPTSTQKHAIFEVAVPLLVTGACVVDPLQCVPGQPQANTDPPYFYFFRNNAPGPINSATFSAFGDNGDDLGAKPTMSGILPATAYSIGLAPTATPFCTPATCLPGNPPPAPPPGSIPYALCASLPDNSNGPAAHLRPAVGAYYAIATDGEMYLSAPVPSVFSACPAL